MKATVEHPTENYSVEVVFNLLVASPQLVAHNAALKMGLDTTASRWSLRQLDSDIDNWEGADFQQPFVLNEAASTS